METGFLVLIGIVFVVTIIFGIIIWKHSIKFEKKALILKQRKEAYIKELEQQQAKIEALGGEKKMNDAPVDGTNMAEEKLEK